MLCIEGYCENPDCPARQVTVDIKDHDHELLPLLKRNGLTCMVCKAPLSFNRAETLGDNGRRCSHEARCSVSRQMYSRDYARQFRPLCPTDDRLRRRPVFADAARLVGTNSSARRGGGGEGAPQPVPAHFH